MTFTRYMNAVATASTGKVSHLRVTFTYNPEDPFLVRFLPTPETPWLLALDTLIDGYRHQFCGWGDATTQRLGEHYYLNLSSPDGRVSFQVKRLQMAAFLTRVAAEAPTAEQVGEHVDAALEQLLGGAR